MVIADRVSAVTCISGDHLARFDGNAGSIDPSTETSRSLTTSEKTSIGSEIHWRPGGINSCKDQTNVWWHNRIRVERFIDGCVQFA